MDRSKVHINDLQSMLHYISSDTSHSEWVRMLMAMKSEFGDSVKEIAQVWSQSSQSFDDKGFKTTWKSIEESGGITIASLIHQAQRNGFQSANLSSLGKPRMDAEHHNRQLQRKEADLLEEECLYKKYIESSNKAYQILANADLASLNNPYLKRKGIHIGKLLDSVFSYKTALVIPLYGTKEPFKGKVQTLQFIQCDGTKYFLSGGKKAGGYFPIQWIDNAEIVICEGFATGASLAEHYTSYSSVICAFDAGNLLNIARKMRFLYPKHKIIIAGDNDHQHEWNGGVNTGKKKAIEASFLINAGLAIPEFKKYEQGSDWNDRANLDGLFGVVV